MATPLIPGDIVQVVWGYDVFAQRCMNVMHYYVENTPPGVTYQEQLDNIYANMVVDEFDKQTTAIANCLASNCSLYDYTVQRVYPGRSYYVRYRVNLVGTADGGSCTAPNVSAVVVKQSERAGRGRSGTWHQPGIPEGWYAEGLLSATANDPMDILAGTVKRPVTPAGGTVPCLVPGMFNPSAGVGLNFYKIVNTTWDDTLRIMRRRTLRVGI